MMRPEIRRARGFSLVEVMIAMIILSVGVLAVAASSGYITKLTAEGGRSGGDALFGRKQFGRVRSVGCRAAVAGLLQPAVFEPPYLAMCPPAARGEGVPAQSELL